MKVIVNFGEKKVVVPCVPNGDISIRELIRLATSKYCKLSACNNVPKLNSDQVQLRLNNGAVVDPDDRVCDVVDDREELFTVIASHPIILNSNGELSSSMTSSNLSTSLSDHERPGVPPPPPKPSLNHRHEVIVTDADLRVRSLRIKTELNNSHQSNMLNITRPNHSPLPLSSSFDHKGMYNVHLDEKTGDKLFHISLPKENSPLGIHVIPSNSNEEQVNGLVLQNIESNGRIKRQGILEVNDRIIEINGINIEQCSFERAQLIFRNALLEPELELKIVRSNKKASSPFFLTNPTEINQTNKRLGKIIKITLNKGTDGLGFKLASRDNPTGVVNPIYVKTIFPRGAAIEDGRLRNGDRLLTVNSIDVTQMSLQETVGLLRETRIGETVHLCISRQHDGSLPKDLLNEDVKSQIMTFDIPLRDTSSAGLGITLKGKTSIIEGQSMDLGIFVKSILTGGAAYRDNRLRSNDQILVINDCSLINMTNLEAANILHDAVRKEIQPGYIKITVSRDEQCVNSKNVKETELLPPSSNTNNDENELDLTNFIPPTHRKPPLKADLDIQSPSTEKEPQEEVMNGHSNPFERETPFRQSISEKRRLIQQPTNHAVQWKQQSFHEARTNSERRQPVRVLADSSSNLIRSSSYESIQRAKEDDEQKHPLKSRNRACNDSFRQAVDKSYGQNHPHEMTNGEKSHKSEKSRFKFTNLFTTKSKRKDNPDEKLPSNQTIRPLVHPGVLYPPPPLPFSSQQDPIPSKSQNHERISTNFSHRQQQCYQPYHFDANQMSQNHPKSDHFLPPPRYDSPILPGRSSISIPHQKSSYPPIPRQFLNGTQSLKQHHPTLRSPYLSAISVQSNSFTAQKSNVDLPINTSQRIVYPPTPSRSHLQFENPANV